MHIQSNHKIQAIGNKLINLPTKNPKPDHIGYVFKITLISDWYDSICSNYEKMEKYTTFSAPFLRSLLPPNTKIHRPRIYFRVKKTTIENKYYLYSRTCAYGSSMLEGVELTLSYAPVDSIRPLCTTIVI